MVLRNNKVMNMQKKHLKLHHQLPLINFTAKIRDPRLSVTCQNGIKKVDTEAAVTGLPSFRGSTQAAHSGLLS